MKIRKRQKFSANALWKRLREGKVSYLMLLPYALVFFVFIMVPVIVSVALSFTNFNMLQFPKLNGLANYIRLILDDEVFTIAVTNTLVFALVTGPVGYARKVSGHRHSA